jgi:hypothetical protein
MRRLVASAMCPWQSRPPLPTDEGHHLWPGMTKCQSEGLFNSLVRNDPRLVCTVASEFDVEAALRRQLAK